MNRAPVIAKPTTNGQLLFEEEEGERRRIGRVSKGEHRARFPEKRVAVARGVAGWRTPSLAARERPPLLRVEVGGGLLTRSRRSTPTAVPNVHTRQPLALEAVASFHLRHSELPLDCPEPRFYGYARRGHGVLSVVSLLSLSCLERPSQTLFLCALLSFESQPLLCCCEKHLWSWRQREGGGRGPRRGVPKEQALRARQGW